MVKFIQTDRVVLETEMCHDHVTTVGYLRKHTGQPGQMPQHKLTWNYHSERKRWEAQCELTDTIYYSAASYSDYIMRRGRTI